MNHNPIALRIIRRFRITYIVISILVCVTMATVLLLTVADLPEYGKTGNPGENEVFHRYLQDGVNETGAVNIVAAIILDYRAFDTLGEAIVLFMALIAVFVLLGNERSAVERSVRDQGDYELAEDQIFQTIAAVIIPCLLLFGLYIVANGHISAGGGFAGGAVLGAAMIMYQLAYGLEKTRRFLNSKTFPRYMVGALMLYACAKGFSFFTGGNHLDLKIPLGDPGSIFSAGLILPLNAAVGLAVACAIYGLFTLFYSGEI